MCQRSVKGTVLLTTFEGHDKNTEGWFFCVDRTMKNGVRGTVSVKTKTEKNTGKSASVLD